MHTIIWVEGTVIRIRKSTLKTVSKFKEQIFEQVFEVTMTGAVLMYSEIHVLFGFVFYLQTNLIFILKLPKTNVKQIQLLTSLWFVGC